MDIAPVQTTVQQTQVDDLAELFSQGPSAAQVLTPQKNNIFSKENDAVAFLENFKALKIFEAFSCQILDDAF